MASFVFKNFLHSSGHRTDQFLATYCNFVIILPDQNNGFNQFVDSCTVFRSQLFLIIPDKFSMEFKSGEFPGHSKTFIPFSCNIFCTFTQNTNS